MPNGPAPVKPLLLTALHRGRLCALGSAVSFGMVAVLAGLAYAGGASPGTVVLSRLLSGALAASAVVAVLHRPWSLRRSEWRGTALVAVAWLVVSVAYMASFYYIPVSLAVLIFFTFPVLIALVAPLVDGRRPEPITLVAAIAAFLGLALALGPDIDGLDWRGCGLALLAALGGVSTFILSRRLVVEQDMFTFSLHLHAICVLAVLLALPAIGLPELPAVARGWVGILGVSVFYVLAVVLQFAAIRLAGPARASIVFNAEPVITMIAAGLLLGEMLGTWQIAGASLVIAAVLWSARADRMEI